MNQPYKSPFGILGCFVTSVAYCFILIFADKIAFITAGIITVVCIIFYYLYFHKEEYHMLMIEEKMGVIEELDTDIKVKMDNEYNV